MAKTRKRLSPHFVIEEFDCRDGTRVPAGSHAALQNLCRTFLEPLRKKYGPVTITSGYRTQRHNARVGGEKGSFHIYTLRKNQPAVDLRCARGRPAQWHAVLNNIRRQKRGGRGGLGLYRGFVHVDLRGYQSNWRG